MKMKIILALTAYVTLLSCAHAQSTIQTVLTRIQVNNPALKAEDKRIKAASVGFHSGISLYDPVVQYDYMKGTPASAGNQNDLSVTQPFDFPSVYTWRKKIAWIQSGQTEHEKEMLRRKILSEAKRTCLELIYLNKLRTELLKREKGASLFYEDYQKKFDLHDATILDVNKAKLRLSGIQSEVALTEAEIEQHLISLQEMNGGIAVSFADTVYPSIPALPSLEVLEKEIELADPMLHFLGQQKQLEEAKARLNRALWLPKMEAGYHFQGILGQTYQGAHVGLTIPLWENKNKVQYQMLQTEFVSAEMNAHLNEHNFCTQKLYEQYTARKSAFDAYAAQMQTLLITDPLDKALQAGQITVLEYYMELTLYYESFDRYLRMEKEYHLALADLLQYKL